MQKLKEYYPALAMVFVAVASSFAAVITDDKITSNEAVLLGLSILAALSTYIVPRVPSAPWLKSAIAFLFAGLTALQAALTDGVTTAEVVLIVIAAFGGIGVLITQSNAPVAPILGKA